MKLSKIRKITIAAAFLLVIVGLLFNTGTGTLSSFGWKEIAAICPLGVVEGLLASKMFIPRALIVLGIIILFVAVFGKVFCAWLCPVPPVKTLVEKIGKKMPKGNANAKDKNTVDTTHKNEVEQTANSSALGSGVARGSGATPAALSQSEVASLKSSGCSSCAQQRAKLDSRHVVLGGSLLSAALFGFPVFCLICPIGLIFGTIIIFWQWVGFNDISFSLLIYPAILVVELVVLKKWCVKFCPLGAMLSLMSLPNRLLRPKVAEQKCLQSKGLTCTNCVDVCPEGLDPHSSVGMNECSKCGLCLEKCPASAITIPFYAKQDKLLKEEVLSKK